MKLNQLISCIILVMLVYFATCVDQGAYNYFATPSNTDPNSCILNVTYAVAAKKVTFTVLQYHPDPANPSCSFQPLTSAPVWYNVPFTAVNLNLTVSASNPNKFTGIWQYTDFKAALGSSCFEAGTFGGQIVNACRFQLGSVYFYLNLRLALPSNDSFDTTWTGILFPELITTKNETRNGFQVWVSTGDYPHLIGRVENGCNTWNGRVTLNTEVTVLGTHWLGDHINLSSYLNGTYLLDIIVLKNGANPKNYVKKQMTGDTFASQPFNSPPSVGECTDVGVKYGDILSNATYCANGCALSFLVASARQAYILNTNGFATGSSLRV